MVKKARFILSIFIVLAAVKGTAAQTNTSTIFRFLDIPSNARAAALGGNHAGLYGADASLFHANPAYLNADASGTVSASYINFLGDAHMGFTNGTYTNPKLGTFAAGIRYVGYGEFDQLDENGEQLGNFSANDLALTGAYSMQVLPQVTAGAALDLIHSSYGSYNSSAAGLSGGVFYQDTSAHFSAGISVTNIGLQVSTYDGRREPFPLDVSAGITKKPEAFPFQLSLTLRQLNNWDLRIPGETERPNLLTNLARHVIFGGETYLGDNLAVRFGYNHYLQEQTHTGGNFSLAGISFGVGFHIKSFTIDFSRNSYSKLGGITRLSIKTRIL